MGDLYLVVTALVLVVFFCTDETYFDCIIIGCTQEQEKSREPDGYTKFKYAYTSFSSTDLIVDRP